MTVEEEVYPRCTRRIKRLALYHNIKFFSLKTSPNTVVFFIERSKKAWVIDFAKPMLFLLLGALLRHGRDGNRDALCSLPKLIALLDRLESRSDEISRREWLPNGIPF